MAAPLTTKDSALKKQKISTPLGTTFGEAKSLEKLYPSAKRSIVVGKGPSPAKVMLIGEAPGADDDMLGEPFLGTAGQLMGECLQEAGLLREEIYITNVVKCRPPGNRKPTTKEISEHIAILVNEIESVKPDVILLAGATALSAVLNMSGITKLHGQRHKLEYFDYGTPIAIPIFHPSYLLRRGDDPAPRKKVVKELVKVRKIINGEANSGSSTHGKYTLIRSRDEFDRVMDILMKAEVVDFDLETTGTDWQESKKGS